MQPVDLIHLEKPPRPVARKPTPGFTHWLNDYEVMDFLGVILRNAAVDQARLTFDLYVRYPSTVFIAKSLLDQKCSCTCMIRQPIATERPRTCMIHQTIATKGILFSIINVNGNHWTVYALDCRFDDGHIVWYFDPLGNSPPHDLWNAIRRRFPRATLRVLKQRVQYDGCHCGIWCIAFVSKMIGIPTTGRVAFSMAPDYFVNTSALDKQFMNTSRILDFRKTLVNIVNM